MTPNERRLTHTLLRMASEQFSRHGCNDFPRPEWFPKDEWDDLHKREHEYNGDPEEYEPRECLDDWVLMSFMAYLLISEDVKPACNTLMDAAPDLLRACKMISQMAVAWQALTPGDISEVEQAISRAEGHPPRSKVLDND